jgi:ABC-type transport system involved in cytochrome c biogenesis permease subunit
MTWSHFPAFALASGFLWIFGSALFLGRTVATYRRVAAHVVFVAGLLVFGAFIMLMWQTLGRAPLRTLGETRLWYAFFMPMVGYLTFVRWRFAWILWGSIAMAAVFIGINLMHPEYQDRALMPALQSPWFVPHVVVYMFAYALLGASALIAGRGLIDHYRGTYRPATLKMADNVVYIGFGFLTLGLLFGALWGKEAWGHYWMWDPKETWAFLTWIAYLGYMHIRANRPGNSATALWTLVAAFAVLLICWFGVNYLPSAANSVHTYTR